LARTSSAQATISAGCIKSAPQAPRLPAFIAAIESEGGHAPAIGASKTGIFKPKRQQNASARACSGDMFRSYQPHDRIELEWNISLADLPQHDLLDGWLLIL
jgi:hypothetical protein